jgi:hypothetical protein
MRVRKRLRRIKRLAYLGTAVGGLVAFRRAKAAREAPVAVGPPSTWPPLQVSEPPVAAAGDLARAGDAAAPSAPSAGEPVVSDEPVTGPGNLGRDLIDGPAGDEPTT